MSYNVKEIYYTIQGEGHHTGRPAVFLRFAGCNLWSGREADRTEAVCSFCDTDFVGLDGPHGGKYADEKDLARAVVAAWPQASNGRFVVITGGEPLLQLDAPLIEALHLLDTEIAIETNGTVPVPPGVDWVCVSPKANAPLVQTQGDELKLVYPQKGGGPERYAGLDFRFFSLQPMDGPEIDQNTELAVQYCKSHPLWSLSIQTHKILGIP